MLGAIWTLIGVVIAGLISLAIDARASHRELRKEFRGEMGELRQELHRLSEGQAEMHGQLDVLVRLAHTHETA